MSLVSPEFSNCRRIFLTKSGLAVLATGVVNTKFFRATEAFAQFPEITIQPFYDSPTEISGFHWKREEILFGSNAGFEEARAGIPLGIWINPALTNIDLSQIILPWNVMAHHLGRPDLFYSEEDPDQAKIHFMPSQRNYVTATPSLTSPYEFAVVYLTNYNNSLAGSHELGHTLGLVDFIARGSDKNQKVNSQICDTKGRKIRSIMTYSYCDWEMQPDWFGEDDKNLLKVAGYA